MQSLDFNMLLSEWTDELMLTLCDNNSFGIALFNNAGDLLCANAAMVSLCVDFDSSSLINPTFEKLVSLETSDLVLFSGFLTIGKYNSVNTTIEAKVYWKTDRILITGGINVSGLIEQNKTMHILNQKVTNLQRQLMREKAELDHTMKELKDIQQMLIHSEKMNAMGNLVAGVAHEVNNPIAFVYSNVFSLDKYIGNIVHSYSELEQLIQTRCNQELIDLASEIRKKNDLDFLIDDITDITTQSKIGLERVKTIVEDLRRFSRLDEAEMKSIDLIENISSTILISNLELSKRNILYTLIAPKKLMVECYPGQLNQALLNVILNAAQAIEADGNLTITVTETEHQVTISVLDDGCGIAPEIKDKIFDPFFTTKPIGSGTGLGLSITYKIITEMHKGTIQVDSTLGKGTCFILSIPKLAYEIKGKEQTIN